MPTEEAASTGFIEREHSAPAGTTYNWRDMADSTDTAVGSTAEAIFVGMTLVCLFFALCRGWYTPELVVSLRWKLQSSGALHCCCERFFF